MKIIYVFLFIVVIGSAFVTSFSENVSNETPNVSVKVIADAPYMAAVVVQESKEFNTAVLITNRFLISGARFLKRHSVRQMFVLMGLSNVDRFLNLGESNIKNVFFARNLTMGLIEMEYQIKYNNVQRPISLLMKNVLDLNFKLELKQGMKKMEILGYDYEENIDVDILKSITLYERMDISDLAKQTFTINPDVDLTFYHNGACLIMNGQLAGVALYVNETQNFQGNFSSIPYHFKWISDIVGYENLQEAFFNMLPEN